MFENLTVQQVTLIVVGILAGISAVTAGISFWLEKEHPREWWGDWFQGISTEMVGAVMTTLFFTFIVGTVQDQQAQAELKAELTGQLGSIVNSEAARAAEELSARGWLRDGSLRGADLYSANLAHAVMFGADLQEATLFDAILAGANLEGANLRRAILQGADLSQANLKSADLTGAMMETANLEAADLSAADLSGANLLTVNLENANLSGAKFDPSTTLPDETTWTPGTDMERFTNPQHPDFWRPQPSPDGFLPWWLQPDE